MSNDSWLYQGSQKLGQYNIRIKMVKTSSEKGINPALLLLQHLYTSSPRSTTRNTINHVDHPNWISTIISAVPTLTKKLVFRWPTTYTTYYLTFMGILMYWKTSIIIINDTAQATESNSNKKKWSWQWIRDNVFYPFPSKHSSHKTCSPHLFIVLI